MAVILIIILGLFFGFLAKISDIYFCVEYLGMSLSDMTSEMGVWILIGVIISLYSKNKKRAMINIFLFSISMLFSYYLTAELTNSIYGYSFIKFWSIFSLLTPIFAYIVCLTKEKNKRSFFIKLAIIISYILIDIIIYGGPRIYDILFVIILIRLLFFRKDKKLGSNR